MINYERYGYIRALDFNDKNNYKHAFNNKFDIVLKQYYTQCINDDHDVWCYCDNGDTYEMKQTERIFSTCWMARCNGK